MGIRCDYDHFDIYAEVYWEINDDLYYFPTYPDEIDINQLAFNSKHYVKYFYNIKLLFHKVLFQFPHFGYSLLEGRYRCVIKTLFYTTESEFVQIELSDKKIISILEIKKYFNESSTEDIAWKITENLRDLLKRKEFFNFENYSCNVNIDLKAKYFGDIVKIEHFIYVNSDNEEKLEHNLSNIKEILRRGYDKFINNLDIIDNLFEYYLRDVTKLKRLAQSDECEEVIIKNSTLHYTAKFYEAKIGKITQTSSTCADGSPIATAICVQMNSDYPILKEIKWKERTECFPKKENVTTQLSRIAENAKNTSDSMKITSETKDAIMNKNLTSTDISKVGDILDNLQILFHSRVEKQSIINVVEIANEILKAPAKEIMDAQMMSNSSSKVITAIEKACHNWNNPNERNAKIYTPRVMVEVWQGRKVPFNSFLIQNLTDNNLLKRNSFVMKNLSNYRQLNKSDAGIFFEDSLKFNKRIRVVTSIFSNTKLFWRNTSKIPISKIISASVTNTKLENLDPPISTVFLPNSDINKIYADRIKCVFWDKNAEDWSQEGCYFEQIINDRIFCKCNHFTNFAVLMDVERSGSNQPEALSYISIIGISLSIGGLGFIIISFIVFR